jgi:hypothetical protein
MTLREALQKVNRMDVFRYIHKKDSKNIAKCDRPTFKQTEAAYTKVIDELLSKPKTKPYKLTWLVQESKDPFDNKPYADVCFLNPDYVEPPKGAKPWGARNKKDKVPAGHYNCNDDKYNKTFGAGFESWSKVIDTPIINEAGYPLEKLVAEMLWEITFYGWTEEKTKETVKMIEGRLKEALEDIDSGKTIPLSDLGGKSGRKRA